MQERTVNVGTISTFDLHVLRNALAVYSDYTKGELESGALSASDREVHPRGTASCKSPDS